MRLTKPERERVRMLFGGRCAYCGEQLGDRWHADHFQPVERKLALHPERGVISTGEFHRPQHDTIENLMPACIPCNLDKWALDLEGWRRKLQDSCGVLKRNQPTYRHAVRFGLVAETGARVEFYFERIAREAAADGRVEAPTP